MNSLLNQLLSLRNMEYLVVDREFNILKTSLEVQRFADCPNQVTTGKDVRLSFPELIGIEDILIAILQGRQVSFELKGIGRSLAHGTPLYIDVYIIKNQSEERLDNRLIIFFEDVTERMILEQKLVQRANEVSLILEAWAYSSDYLNKIIMSMADVLLITTPSGIIKLGNQAAQNLFEYSEDELMGKSASIIIDEQFVLEVSQRLLFSEKTLKNVEVSCKTKTGKEVAIAFSCSAIQTDIENVQDFIYIGREITERYHTQKHLAAH
ncbi:MAG TPA: PAS domain S-box protein [Coleofasciculaceae cyanobacterium]|jgi:PAS domain S-box-containing protein